MLALSSACISLTCMSSLVLSDKSRPVPLPDASIYSLVAWTPRQTWLNVAASREDPVAGAGWLPPVWREVKSHM